MIADVEPSRRLAALYGLILGLGLVARLVVMAPEIRRGAVADPDNYLPIAVSLAEGRGFTFDGRPTAYRPPLYPLTLAPGVAAVGPERAWAWVLALNAALGVATIATTIAAARALGLGPWSAGLAGLIVAIDPVLVVQSRSAMTETLAATLNAATLGAIALSDRPGRPGRRATIAAGLWLGLGVLCRPGALVGAGLIVAASAMGAGPGRRRRPALILAGIVAAVAPWAVRNLLVFGEPIATTTHGGYTLALANNPTYYREVLDGPPGAVWTGPEQARWFAEINARAAGLAEPAADRLFRSIAIETIAANPGQFARAALARLGRFAAIAPSGSVYPRSIRWLSAVWTAPIWALVVAGLTSTGVWRWPRSAAPLMVAGLAAVHLAYWCDLRMRAPVVPAIALVAAVGADRLIAGYAARRRS